ncbi:hypothetical protein CDD83_85 [Cordyceps sp. RAO-2017]|nr:hypothetical protein CDD83_85 [Cordyceps sp. RAO-2017]
MRIFISEHKWKEGLPTKEEAIMMLNQGDDSATQVPAVFIYTAVEVLLDRAYPGHRISVDMTIHFGPPAGIILESETTRDFHFVGMPPCTNPPNAHKRQDAVSEEATVAAERRHS